MEENYLDKNRNSWNKRAELHIGSEFYDVKGFLEGKSSLNSIETELLGDLQGKSVLHLQCHFGQDSISLARLGAEVTGMDLSDKAIEFAKELAGKDTTNAKFICCDVYDLPNHLDGEFDIVFTSYGTIGWLPDLDKWAKVISHFLKPDGKFLIVEFHPFVWMFNDEFNEIAYNYFKDKPIVEVKDSSYTDGNFSEKIEDISWNHSLSEVINSLINNGLKISHFKEYDYSPYDIFSGGEESEKGKFRIRKFGDKIPMVYSLVAIKS